jgi:predicted AAA+ superfamily ATPase
MSELNLEKGCIITRNEADSIPVKAGIIEIIPVWRFLLENEY